MQSTVMDAVLRVAMPRLKAMVDDAMARRVPIFV
jgi:hypothetical protein